MKTLLKLPTTRLHVNYYEKTAIGVFKGDISFEDYQSILLSIAELAGNDLIENVIIDRRQIHSLDTQSRLWVKNYFIKEYAKPVAHKVKKVAVIQSQSIVGQLYGKTIYTTLRLVYPNLKIKYFKTLGAAEQWINEGQPGPIKVKDVLADESKLFSDLPKLEKDLEKQQKIAIINRHREARSMDTQETFELGARWSPMVQGPDLLNRWVNVIFP